MQTILITGSNGQLGNEFRVLKNSFPQYNFLFTDVDELDITDQQALNLFLESNPVDFIINCAAYTNVDKAETERKLAWKINVTGAQNLALVSCKINALFVHVSTDYVFDGMGVVPYDEQASANPQGYYGKSKHAGEQAVIASGARSLIVRTAWLYSSYGNNFVKTMQRLGKERGHLRVVADQAGSPTFAADLAAAILVMIRKYHGKGIEIYHYANQGVTSWYGFACEIIKLSGIACTVEPIGTKDYPLPAPRPAYSVLNTSKIMKDFGIQIPQWQESLARCIELM